MKSFKLIQLGYYFPAYIIIALTPIGFHECLPNYNAGQQPPESFTKPSLPPHAKK